MADTGSTAITTTESVPIWGFELKDYINIGTPTAPNWQDVTNLLSWEFDDDSDTYEPDYIDTKQKKTFVIGKSATIDYEKDMYTNNPLDEWLASHEDDSNVACEVMRVRTWQKGSAEGTLWAKKAAYLLSPQQMSKNDSGEPVKLNGTLTMNDADWTKGDWNASTGKFTPAAA
jgi:hypothetical protein